VCARRGATSPYLSGYLRGVPGASALRQKLLHRESLAACLEVLDDYRARGLAALADAA
jgi:hypothetical protein